jgi:hypothetical protein
MANGQNNTGEENVVAKALYELVQIFQEIDRDMKKRAREESESGKICF